MKRLALLTLLLSTLGLYAHPGHGLVDSGLAHWFLSVEHLALILVAAILLVVALRREKIKD